MAFVNEYISQEDREKYGLDEIDKKFIVGGAKARDWTVDKDRNMYLRNVANGREEFFYITTWTFYWHGELIVFEKKGISTTGPIDGDRYHHGKILRIDIPQDMQSSKEQIIEDLKEALTAYKDGGIFSKAKGFTLTLDVE